MSFIFPPAYEQGLSRLRIRTIVRLRWIAVLGQTAAVVGVYWGLEFELPIVLCLLIIALSAWLNIFLRIRFPARERTRNVHAAAMLAYDLLQISGLLYLTGGLQNPFAFLMIAPVTVAASTQPPRTTIILGALAIVCVSALTVFQKPLPWFPGETLELPLLYIAGVWAALVSGAIFFSLYAWRIAKETRQMSAALALTEMALLREQKMSALDGLAAAAAHELGTPLGTIAVVAKELLREVPDDSELREDVELLRSQSERCREILGRLTRSSGETDTLVSHASLTHLLEEVVQPYCAFGIEILVTSEATGPETAAGDDEPQAARNPGVLYGLGNLVANAVEFATKKVTVEATWNENTVTVTIADDGPGFSPLVMERLGEPYVTSRPVIGEDDTLNDDGDGLGLGFFIAKTLLERTGASLEFKNRAPAHPGAVVQIVWPRDAIESLIMDGEDQN
ncbi:MAG: ActS/PrrB/RegB family redox-sensitive histidine kinase [Hyphomicrobiales bacterium]|nr:ActS/PrrB/RegB family redox-sensitive histidine kinase [Hyphomicrobiales bacterium]